MFPELQFWLLLLLKMAVTAGFVVFATVIAERAGPVVAAMIATLPIAAGPAYVFIALHHGPDFIAQSALASLAVNVVTAIFALAYAVLAQRHGRAASLLPAVAIWLVLAALVTAVPWTTLTAIAFNAIGLPVCILIGNRFRHVHVPPVPRRWTDLLMRAGMVAVLVTLVVSASEVVGPKVTGLLAVFPIVLLSLILILHPRIGGPATAAVLANTLLGLAGFALCLLTAHLLVTRVGTVAGLVAALAVAVACNLAFWAFRRRSALAASRA